jgi:general stress protein 26
MVTSDAHGHLYKLLQNFSTGMLASQSADGFHARPMAIAQLQPDADAYFATDARSSKITEINANPLVLITFQNSSEFASLYGRASIVTDRALIEKLWSEGWRVWFPGGKTDPNLVLIRVEAQTGEYWDNSGSEGLKYLFEGLKAYVTGRRPETDASQNAKVRLG